MKSNPLVNEWFEKGNHDLEGAQILLEANHYTDTICFLIQQAIEKYLKGFLVANRKRPEKTHNITKLISQCQRINPEFSQFLKVSVKISGYYIPSRYPTATPTMYTRDETEEALQVAHKIINLIESSLKS